MAIPVHHTSSTHPLIWRFRFIPCLKHAPFLLFFDREDQFVSVYELQMLYLQHFGILSFVDPCLIAS